MKQIEVKINGVKYLPENTSLTIDDKPPGEKDVNYRALVNDKLDEFGTYGEDDFNARKHTHDDMLFLATMHSNEDSFIIAGRVQEVVTQNAYYGGEEPYTLFLKLYSGYTWEYVYDRLLKNEHFIETGERK